MRLVAYPAETCNLVAGDAHGLRGIEAGWVEVHDTLGRPRPFKRMRVAADPSESDLHAAARCAPRRGGKPVWMQVYEARGTATPKEGAFGTELAT